MSDDEAVAAISTQANVKDKKRSGGRNNKSKISKKKEKAHQRDQERKQAVYNAFNSFYEQEFGAERWSTLLEALKQPVRHCMMINKYSHSQDLVEKLKKEEQEETLTRLKFTHIPCLASITHARLPAPSKDRNNVKDYYILDAGSVLATEALDIQPHDRVLDLCAAPGGKSISILQRLDARAGGHLTANEISPDRRRRLRQVMDEYIPKEIREDIVTVVGKDGTKWYSEPEQYDKVLLDAPCSSERHLLHDEKEFEQWSPKRTAHNAQRQLALLKAAVYSVCVDGIVVYGTCSISSAENDKVVSKLLRKSKVPVEVIRRSWPIGEKTKYGWIILPDKTEGWGPLYFAVIRRTGVGKEEELPSEDDEGDEKM